MPILQLTPSVVFDNVRMAAEVRDGLPVSAFYRLRNALGVSQEFLSQAVSIPSRTVMRRQAARKRFKPDESERILRLVRILLRAQQVLASADRAKAWMLAKNRALGGISPLDCAKSEPGAREVENILGRFEHGVFS
jgi:putative toxin-antitoxin system antitoxin component (TIGR02293 family)